MSTFSSHLTNVSIRRLRPSCYSINYKVSMFKPERDFFLKDFHSLLLLSLLLMGGMPWCTCGSQKTTFQSWFSLSTMVLGMELKLAWQGFVPTKPSRQSQKWQMIEVLDIWNIFNWYSSNWWWNWYTWIFLGLHEKMQACRPWSHTHPQSEW